VIPQWFPINIANTLYTIANIAKRDAEFAIFILPNIFRDLRGRRDASRHIDDRRYGYVWHLGMVGGIADCAGKEACDSCMPYWRKS
jgi:hypothetical protein